ncbi:hypothetical protein O181_001085 [Austropuccinia psidii MF-1]|uniref:Uncharacterized protein n=1 Tax=Austropuccinia psidii MF-1 TaxID=1389203 RepID=A0A9Q3BAA5_9BASI|nr:hypothetical protein [Austropuccinia psidii MF-1]
MSVSTRLKKAADDDADDKPLSNKEVYSLLNSLKSEVMSLKSTCTSDAAEMQSLQMALSSPPPASSPYHSALQLNSSAYDRFMQEPYQAADRFDRLRSDSTNYPEWVASLNRVLCIAFNLDVSIDDSPSLLDNQTPQENRVISHFIDATLLADFTLCIGIMPSRATAKEFFDTVRARCCPGNRFQKLKVVQDLLSTLIENGSGMPKPNNTIVLTLRHSLSLFKKLGIKAEELEGLLAQVVCHAPPTLDQAAFDQLIRAAILSKGKEKPSSTFMGQVILNAS